MRRVMDVECTLLVIPDLLICVSLHALDILFYPRHDFSHEIFPTILEFPYKHLLVQMYNFDGHFVEVGEILLQQLRGPLENIKETYG